MPHCESLATARIFNTTGVSVRSRRARRPGPVAAWLLLHHDARGLEASGRPKIFSQTPRRKMARPDGVACHSGGQAGLSVAPPSNHARL